MIAFLVFLLVWLAIGAGHSLAGRSPIPTLVAAPPDQLEVAVRLAALAAAWSTESGRPALVAIPRPADPQAAAIADRLARRLPVVVVNRGEVAGIGLCGGV